MTTEPDPMPEFTDLANEAQRQFGEDVVAFAEARLSDDLPAGVVYFAAVNGAIGAALLVLDAACKAGALTTPREELFAAVVRQTADTWGQINRQPAATTGFIQ